MLFYMSHQPMKFSWWACEGLLSGCPTPMEISTLGHLSSSVFDVVPTSGQDCCIGRLLIKTFFIPLISLLWLGSLITRGLYIICVVCIMFLYYCKQFWGLHAWYLNTGYK